MRRGHANLCMGPVLVYVLPREHTDTVLMLGKFSRRNRIIERWLTNTNLWHVIEDRRG